jgi:hypothetical protein
MNGLATQSLKGEEKTYRERSSTFIFRWINSRLKTSDATAGSSRLYAYAS